jgi:hypothetical protein
MRRLDSSMLPPTPPGSPDANARQRAEGSDVFAVMGTLQEQSSEDQQQEPSATTAIVGTYDEGEIDGNVAAHDAQARPRQSSAFGTDAAQQQALKRAFDTMSGQAYPGDAQSTDEGSVLRAEGRRGSMSAYGGLLHIMPPSSRPHHLPQDAYEYVQQEMQRRAQMVNAQGMLSGADGGITGSTGGAVAWYAVAAESGTACIGCTSPWAWAISASPWTCMRSASRSA